MLVGSLYPYRLDLVKGCAATLGILQPWKAKRLTEKILRTECFFDDLSVQPHIFKPRDVSPGSVTLYTLTSVLNHSQKRRGGEVLRLTRVEA